MIKLKKYYNFIAKRFNPIHWIAYYYINKVNRSEYLHPPFGIKNERPIEYSFVFKQISKYFPTKILDVGTGITAIPHVMANCGIKVTAIDNIQDYWPKGMFNRHFYVINDNIVKSNLNETFDLVTCISVLEHIEEYDKAVSSMAKLLKGGGHLILTFPYNEKRGVANVYKLPDSNVKRIIPFKTQAYSREDIDRWQKENNLDLLEQEYWQFSTGEYWTTGTELDKPETVGKDETHQISCIIFQKK
jgi:2-polyprenyl-3-methyl-5-hydroxy-6-metoxy-1,4-benzoquinol methylase